MPFLGLMFRHKINRVGSKKSSPEFQRYSGGWWKTSAMDLKHSGSEEEDEEDEEGKYWIWGIQCIEKWDCVTRLTCRQTNPHPHTQTQREKRAHLHKQVKEQHTHKTYALSIVLRPCMVCVNVCECMAIVYVFIYTFSYKWECVSESGMCVHTALLEQERRWKNIFGQ